jgi:hypothetical protein
MRKGITALMQATDDNDWKEELKKIDDPIDMLLAIWDYDKVYGWDSYYNDLKKCLWEQAYKVLEENGLI